MRFVTIGLSILFFAFPVVNAEKPLRVLHLSFHQGCVQDLCEVGKELGLDLTSWYIHESAEKFEGYSAGSNIYNITQERAERVWSRHKDYFNQFDVMVTSDTAPLSRIFLQHEWQKPLIIWVCNRFDYADISPNQDGCFPDAAYYKLFAHAAKMPQVKIISYTPYEHFYARQVHGIDIGTRTIKPIGIAEKEVSTHFISAIPAQIVKEKTLFLFPRMAPHQLKAVQQRCENVGIKTYTGSYNGPEDLKEFKGVLFFPYNFSNLALFENIQRGIIHFVPTQEFLVRLGREGTVRSEMYGKLDWCEWYCEEYRDLFVYFNSWNDLAEQVKRVEVDALRKKIRAFGTQHRLRMLAAWHDVFKECT